MRRREFVGGLLSVGSIGLLGGCGVIPDTGESYSVAVLGDTHYDKSPETVYHSAFRKLFDGTGKHPMRYKEFLRNARMWAGPSKKILEASGSCMTPDTRLILQTGDLIQGDCNDFGVHKQMLEDMLACMKGFYPEAVPFVSVCGNHDIRQGNDACDNAALAPYEAFMIPYEKSQLGTCACGTIDDTTFAFRCGPDLYLVINFNKGASTVPVVRRLLSENAHTRYTFVVLHGGVFPFDSWERRWFYLGERCLDAERRDMRKLFASCNAIVICGHTHHLELKEARFEEGLITEMTMNTVQGVSAGADNPAIPEVVREGVERYGDTDWVRSTPDVRSLFAEYQPYMTRYYYANAVGHARLRISDAGVWFDYYGGDARKPTKVFRLR